MAVVAVVVVQLDESALRGLLYHKTCLVFVRLIQCFTLPVCIDATPIVFIGINLDLDASVHIEQTVMETSSLSTASAQKSSPRKSNGSMAGTLPKSEPFPSEIKLSRDRYRSKLVVHERCMTRCQAINTEHGCTKFTSN